MWTMGVLPLRLQNSTWGLGGRFDVALVAVSNILGIRKRSDPGILKGCFLEAFEYIETHKSHL